ncbi:MAG: excalibur calcium-binding domain-containing protein [Phenylobacterium sp.]|uniref:thermonuclease family protein n=1 Tax=Phenylobacterium sp. TaxID=1871053 RepID=UPI002736D96C|nr:excalibur calcium-binding domain-containing protein [Phenylobacterium sp.]MDP3748223.1 excalibur calcium-binding domain-containing protein [Phenylobacterium sp.]
MLRLAILTLSAALTWSAPAWADPCEAIPEQGPLPGYLAFGASFSGPVSHVIDGDSMCVAVGPGVADWVEVRLADFHATELSQPGGAAAKSTLARLALGQHAVCVANLRTYDRIAARCQIHGSPIGDLMRNAGVTEGRAAEGRDPNVRRAAAASPARASAGPAPFQSCAAARAAGAAPMSRGDPGYNPNLDGDGDGLACEPYRGR